MSNVVIIKSMAPVTLSSRVMARRGGRSDPISGAMCPRVNHPQTTFFSGIPGVMMAVEIIINVVVRHHFKKPIGIFQNFPPAISPLATA